MESSAQGTIHMEYEVLFLLNNNNEKKKLACYDNHFFCISTQTTHSLVRGSTRSVTLRWSAWNPFLQPNTPHITVGLVGGPTPSPDGEFVFKVPDTKMQDEISSKTAGGLMAFQWGFGFKVSC